MLTIYAPSNKPESKCWEVFNGIKKTWTTEIKTLDNTATETFNSPLDEYMFWGFTGNNLNLVHQLEDRKLNYWFTDTPYFGRFDNKNLKPDNHYWRIAKNNIHVGMIDDCPEDRLQKFNIKVKDRNKKGKHILVCPSSATVNQYIKQTNFLQQTMRELEKYTDRGVKIRVKPRGNNTSGPLVAKVPIQEDLKDAWCCITSCSISAVESLCAGVPVICHAKSFASPICDTDISKVENPKYEDPMPLLKSLAYQQFTPEEFANGTAVSILKDLKIL